MVRFIIEAVSRDGNAALNIPMRPDGSIEDECVTMLEALGDWMKINGEAVYGSKAWVTPGEGEMHDGRLKKLPGGGLGRHHRDFKFDAQDIRFTVGKNGANYAFCMNVPEDNQVIRIKSMGRQANHPDSIKGVSLLGYRGKLKWRQTDEALEVVFPEDADLRLAVVFRVE